MSAEDYPQLTKAGLEISECVWCGAEIAGLPDSEVIRTKKCTKCFFKEKEGKRGR